MESRRWQDAREVRDSEEQEELTGMPKTDLSPWLTSPLDMVEDVQETRKRGDGKKCQEKEDTRDGKGRKRREERRGGRGQKNTAVRSTETHRQSGSATAVFAGIARSPLPSSPDRKSLRANDQITYRRALEGERQFIVSFWLVSSIQIYSLFLSFPLFPSLSPAPEHSGPAL